MRDEEGNPPDLEMPELGMALQEKEKFRASFTMRTLVSVFEVVSQREVLRHRANSRGTMRDRYYVLDEWKQRPSSNWASVRNFVVILTLRSKDVFISEPRQERAPVTKSMGV